MGFSCCRGPASRLQQLWCRGLVAPWHVVFLDHVESSLTMDQTSVSHIGRQILNHWSGGGYFRSGVEGSLSLRRRYLCRDLRCERISLTKAYGKCISSGGAKALGQERASGSRKGVEKKKLEMIMSQFLSHMLLPFTPLEDRTSVGLRSPLVGVL